MTRFARELKVANCKLGEVKGEVKEGVKFEDRLL